MSRQVRKIKAGWQHPMKSNGHYIPLLDFEDYNPALQDHFLDPQEYDRPYLGDYMPDWSEEEKTQYVMYETTSVGTPESPPFETKEALAHWLADNNVSTFAECTATYEQWLRCINNPLGVMSAVFTSEGIISGVEIE